MTADARESGRRLPSGPVPALLVVLTLAAIAYSRTFSVPWYFDDVSNLVENPLIRDLHAAAGRAFTDRGLGFLSFALDVRRAGLSPAAFHATNLAIHLAASAVALLLLRRLLAPRAELALFGALVFALHPLQTSAVTYVVQRFASLTALLCLTAVLLYVRARDHVDGSDPSGWRFALPYGTAVLVGGAACFVKQNAVVLPVLLLLVEATVRPPARRPGWRLRILARIAPFFVVPIWIALPVARAQVLAPAGEPAAAVESDVVGETAAPLAYLSTESQVIWRYLRRVALPYGQVFDFGLEVERQPWRTPSVVAALGLLILIALAIAARRRAPLVTLGVLWFFVALSVESSVIVLDPYFEHRLYLPMLGVSLVATEGLRLILDRRQRFGALVAFGVVGVLLLLTLHRNEQWRDPVRLWQADLRAGSRSYRSLLGLADALYQRQDQAGANGVYRTFLTRAEARCERAACGARYILNIGVAAERLGRIDEATNWYRLAVARAPGYGRGWYNLGVLQYRAGDKAGALASFRRAADLEPGDPDAVYNRAAVALELGDPVPAERDLEALRRIRPELAESLAHDLANFRRSERSATPTDLSSERPLATNDAR